MNKSKDSSILFFKKTEDANFYSCFFITIFGFVSNLMTIIMLIKTKKQKFKNAQTGLTSAQYYMLAIAVSDALFLVAHFVEDIVPSISPLKTFQFINDYQFVCKFIIHLRNSTRLISSYLGIF